MSRFTITVSNVRRPQVGKITLPSTILQFWDLGGQKGIRNIWPRYYDDCHAVVYVIDAEDRERLGEGWEVFGTRPELSFCFQCTRADAMHWQGT
jgi:hypothetical protein